MDTFVRAFRLSLRIGRSQPMVDHLLLKDDMAESDSIYFPGDANPDKVIFSSYSWRFLTMTQL
jgi:hypothetical protein